MTAPAALSLSGISFRYDGNPAAALRGISLDIPEGQITAILGPNGSGKTTLLRLLLGVLRPAGGTLLVSGRPRASYSRRAQSRLIGLVPQDEHVPFDFSLLEFVLLGRAPYLGPLEMPGPVDRGIALAALHTVGLTHLIDRPVPNLSGGERQLAIVARALAQKPRILLLDEPTAHLDLGNKARLLDILRSRALDGVTVVLTTHDPNLAAAIAHTTVLMRHGQVLDCGHTPEVLTAQALTSTYGVPVQVYDLDGRRIALLP